MLLVGSSTNSSICTTFSCSCSQLMFFFSEVGVRCMRAQSERCFNVTFSSLIVSSPHGMIFLSYKTTFTIKSKNILIRSTPTNSNHKNKDMMIILTIYQQSLDRMIQLASNTSNSLQHSFLISFPKSNNLRNFFILFSILHSP
jgi:hypothetical protein